MDNVIPSHTTPRGNPSYAIHHGFAERGENLSLRDNREAVLRCRKFWKTLKTVGDGLRHEGRRLCWLPSTGPAARPRQQWSTTGNLLFRGGEILLCLLYSGGGATGKRWNVYFYRMRVVKKTVCLSTNGNREDLWWSRIMGDWVRDGRVMVGSSGFHV